MDESQAPATRCSGPMVAMVAQQLQSWGLQVEFAEVKREMGIPLYLILSTDSSDPNEDLMLSASDSEELNVGMHTGVSAE